MVGTIAVQSGESFREAYQSEMSETRIYTNIKSDRNIYAMAIDISYTCFFMRTQNFQ